MRVNKRILTPKKRVFSFVVDGKCELWYLQLLKQHENLNINLEPKLPQKKKLQDQFDLVKDLEKESEKVFWIIDFDSIMKETQEARKGNKTALKVFQELYAKSLKNKNIVVIINNPCLEYWFLQHFEQTSKYYATYENLERSLKKYLSDYEKTERYYKSVSQNIYQKLKPNLQTAISNAEKLGVFDFENYQKGFTEMHKIFEELQLKQKTINKTSYNERFGVIGGVCPQKHLCVFVSSPPASAFVSRQPREAATTLVAILG